MFETNVINEIDLRKDEAEMDVLFAICESYSKMINIVNEVDDESIIQESYTSLFMEAVDNETSNFSIKDFVLGLLGKIFEALKSIMVKIIDVITKRIFRRRETYNALVNSLILLDCFQHVNVKSVVQESGLCEIEFDGIYAEFNNDDVGDNEVIQEKWTPMDEMRYRKAEKNIANAKKEQSGGIRATVAAGTAIAANAGTMAAGIASTATIANVFKTLTGTVIRGYSVRKLTGDMDAKTPTMIHDEQR